MSVRVATSVVNSVAVKVLVRSSRLLCKITLVVGITVNEVSVARKMLVAIFVSSIVDVYKEVSRLVDVVSSVLEKVNVKGTVSKIVEDRRAVDVSMSSEVDISVSRKVLVSVWNAD